MNSTLLQALMMGMNGAGGGGMGPGAGIPGAGVGMPAVGGDSGDGGLLGQGGMSPQLLQFAAGAFSDGGGLQGGVGKLLGGVLAQKMKQRLAQQVPGGGSGNPLDSLLSGDPGSGMQPMG